MPSFDTQAAPYEFNRQIAPGGTRCGICICWRRVGPDQQKGAWRRPSRLVGAGVGPSLDWSEHFALVAAEDVCARICPISRRAMSVVAKPGADTRSQDDVADSGRPVPDLAVEDDQLRAPGGALLVWSVWPRNMARRGLCARAARLSPQAGGVGADDAFDDVVRRLGPRLAHMPSLVVLSLK
jgi:hypothetical protein